MATYAEFYNFDFHNFEFGYMFTNRDLFEHFVGKHTAHTKLLLGEAKRT